MYTFCDKISVDILDEIDRRFILQVKKSYSDRKKKKKKNRKLRRVWTITITLIIRLYV